MVTGGRSNILRLIVISLSLQFNVENNGKERGLWGKEVPFMASNCHYVISVVVSSWSFYSLRSCSTNFRQSDLKICFLQLSVFLKIGR